MPRFNIWEFIGIQKPGTKPAECKPNTTSTQGKSCASRTVSAQDKGGEGNMLRGKRSSDITQQRLQQMYDSIAKKAYDIYEKKGCQNGHDLEDWLEAERTVRRGMRRS